MPCKLINYLKTYRKRSGLFQREVAYLLGLSSDSKVSKYESHARQVNLETALAYAALFGVPVEQLFAGLYAKVEKDTKRRARRLAKKLAEEKPNPTTTHKLEALQELNGSAASTLDEVT